MDYTIKQKFAIIVVGGNAMKKEEIIEQLYNAVMENLKPTEAEKKAQNRLVEIREKFLKKIGVQYRRELEELTDAVIEICLEEEKQFFIEGYKTAETLINNEKRGI